MRGFAMETQCRAGEGNAMGEIPGCGSGGNMFTSGDKHTAGEICRTGNGEEVNRDVRYAWIVGAWEGARFAAGIPSR
jgi:hypothetical protein